MEKFLKLPSIERKEILQEAALKKGLPPAIMEKDFWVCWVLEKLFKDKDLSRILLFKGGTSLSKVFNIIERFSEDVDLILDWRVVTDLDPLLKISKTKQTNLNKTIDEKAAVFISGELKSKIQAVLSPICSVKEDENDNHILHVIYPDSFSDPYIIPKIKLEIGPLASWTPNDEYVVTPYLNDVFPELMKKGRFNLKAIKAERTFWEKVTILHHEAHRPEISRVPLRYSRHYYDMFMLSGSRVRISALKEIKLLKDVVDFKKRFYPRGWAKYDLAKPGTMKLIPPDHVLKFLKTDYKSMKNMIFGEYPSFETIMERLAKLEMEINSLKSEWILERGEQ